MTQHDPYDIGIINGEGMADAALDVIMARNPNVRNTRREIEFATERMFKGVKEHFDQLCAEGLSEADQIAFVKGVLDGFRDVGSAHRSLVKCAVIADATWLKRLVPNAPIEAAEKSGAVAPTPAGAEPA